MKKLQTVVNGFIEVEENKYSFCLNNEELYGNYLSTKRENLYKPTISRNSLEFVEATYNLGGTIAFYNFSYYLNMFDKSLKAKSYGTFIPKNINLEVKGFDAISLKGPIINKFYPPALSVVEKENESYPNEDGSKIIKLKPFSEKSEEIEISIYDEKVKILLSICTPGSVGIDSTNLGEIYSSFRIIFGNTKPLKELMKWVNAVKKVFSFLYFRNDVEFVEIEILESTINGFQKIGNLFIDEKFSNDIPNNSNECVNYFWVKNNFGNLFNVILNSEINLLCLPKDKRESRLVTPEKYVFTCASFESAFSKRFPNYVNDDQNYLLIHDSIIEFLNEKYEYYKGNNRKARDWISKIKKAIERESKNLDHKFNKCLDEYGDLLGKFTQDIEYRYGVKIDENIDLAGNFSSVRNSNAHGSVVEYSKEAIIAFEFGRVLLYIMVLKEALFENYEIEQIISALFVP